MISNRKQQIMHFLPFIKDFAKEINLNARIVIALSRKPAAAGCM